jgi:hypothetical protein
LICWKDDQWAYPGAKQIHQRTGHHRPQKDEEDADTSEPGDGRLGFILELVLKVIFLKHAERIDEAD